MLPVRIGVWNLGEPFGRFTEKAGVNDQTYGETVLK
jgi:hypothetical protein